MRTTSKFGYLAAGWAFACVASAQENIRVIVDGTPVVFHGQGPTMLGDRVLIPLRGVLEQMGARVDWNPSTQMVTARKSGINVRLTIGEKTASVDGQPAQMDVPAQIMDGSTMVPLRFVSESLGEDVHWNSADYTVNIHDSGRLPVHQGISQEEMQRDKLRDAREQKIAGLEKGQPVLFESGIVFPISLDEPLSSGSCHKGDRFGTTLVDEQSGLPSGTHIQGYVYAVSSRNGDHPGVIEVRFDKAILPDGASYPIRGYLARLGDAYTRREGGRLVAVPGSSKDRVVFVGYGSGTLAGFPTREPLGVGSSDGFVGITVADRSPREVRLDSGMKFGVRLVQDLAVKRGDLH